MDSVQRRGERERKDKVRLRDQLGEKWKKQCHGDRQQVHLNRTSKRENKEKEKSEEMDGK